MSGTVTVTVTVTPASIERSPLISFDFDFDPCCVFTVRSPSCGVAQTWVIGGDLRIYTRWPRYISLSTAVPPTFLHTPTPPPSPTPTPPGTGEQKTPTEMTGVDIEKYKRIVQYFWDPEPKNDMAPEAAIWCLGQMYTPHPPQDASVEAGMSWIWMPCTSQIQRERATDTSPDRHDVASSLARAGTPKDPSGCAWPEAFLKDFESRIWMTYRSNFTPIPRNNTPGATSSMTLGVRLRSQLMDSQGFTSDTGWGCMIRSGQSLLANTLCILLLGRGDYGDRHTSRNRAD